MSNPFTLGNALLFVVAWDRSQNAFIGPECCGAMWHFQTDADLNEKHGCKTQRWSTPHNLRAEQHNNTKSPTSLDKTVLDNLTVQIKKNKQHSVGSHCCRLEINKTAVIYTGTRGTEASKESGQVEKFNHHVMCEHVEGGCRGRKADESTRE